jgi:hypothetical protein
MEGGAAGYSFERGPSKDHYSQVFLFNLVKRIPEKKNFSNAIRRNLHILTKSPNLHMLQKTQVKQLITIYPLFKI